jgi:hypothetical protein
MTSHSVAGAFRICTRVGSVAQVPLASFHTQLVRVRWSGTSVSQLLTLHRNVLLTIAPNKNVIRLTSNP